MAMPATRRLRLAACLLVIFQVTPALAADAGAYPTFPDPALKEGRGIWLATCRDCHANPLSDAPQVKNMAAWRKRLEKGKPALYASALRGVSTPSTEMPPRGGNASLKDAQVKAAVDYMVALVNAFDSKPTRKEK
jgi:cytochrome c5